MAFTSRTMVVPFMVIVCVIEASALAMVTVSPATLSISMVQTRVPMAAQPFVSWTLSVSLPSSSCISTVSFSLVRRRRSTGLSPW